MNRYKKRIVIVLSLTIAAAIFITYRLHGKNHKSATNTSKDIYAMTISPSSEGFKDDSRMGFMGNLDGSAIVYINGDPVYQLGGGGLFLQINQWIDSGENEVVVEGKKHKPLYIKIGILRDNEVKKVLVKKIVKPESTAEEKTLKFNAETSYHLPPRETLKLDSASKMQYEKEISEIVRRLQDLIVAHDGNSYAKMQSEWRVRWAREAYGANQIEINSAIKSAADFISDPDLRIKQVDGETLQIIYGRHSAYVWRGENVKSSHKYLFKLMKNSTHEDMEQIVGALRLVRISGKWVIWD